jgi:aryl-alcohol dehydrogenase-like predicted oxidoreductase
MSDVTMDYQLLGRSGLRVSEMCLGTMTFGEDWGWGATKDEARRIYEAYRNAGGNFIDTANIYTGGTSERFVGEFIAGHRDEVVLATKYTNAAGGFFSLRLTPLARVWVFSYRGRSGRRIDVLP